MRLDIEHIRSQFPFFRNNPGYIYLDNAATTQKPHVVIDAVSHWYAHANSSVHRSIYRLSEQATHEYEGARTIIANFINARSHEIIFTKGATEGINLVAQGWAAHMIKAGDEIVITQLEHHANLLPWQRIARQCGATLKYIPILPNGELNYTDLATIITPKTTLVAITACSNAIGTVINCDAIIKTARLVGAAVLVDAAQVAPYTTINVKILDTDFLVFSGHKMLGPTGIGVLYIHERMHKYVDPYQLGGGMVTEVGWHDATWTVPPHKFEAGTPPIAQAIGLARAIDYITPYLKNNQLITHTASLCAYLINKLQTLPHVTIIGPVDQLATQGHVVSFIVHNIHPHDVAAHLDHYNIAVRAGTHCAQPLTKAIGYDATIRVSFYLYNTHNEVDALINALRTITL